MEHYKNKNQPLPQAQAQQTQNLFSFPTPTEFVELPSKGLFYGEGHPLQGVETVEIKHMTAKEEDILSSETLIKKGLVMNRLLKSVLVSASTLQSATKVSSRTKS